MSLHYCRKKNKLNVVPQLGGNEEIFSLDPPLREALLQGSSDLCLIAVDVGTVDVNVAFLQGSFHGIAHLSWLRQPRANYRGSKRREGKGEVQRLGVVFTPPRLLMQK